MLVFKPHFKMEDIRCKARLVVGKALATIMYASILSREIVRIALMIATLNELEVKPGNILNAYVQVPFTEKVWKNLRVQSLVNMTERLQ